MSIKIKIRKQELNRICQKGVQVESLGSKKILGKKN